MGSHVLLLYIRMGVCKLCCVMLSATVPGHDAAFLSLLFQRPRLEVFQRLTVG